MESKVAVIKDPILIENLMNLPLNINRNVPLVLLGNNPYGNTCAIQSYPRLARSSVARLEEMTKDVINYDTNRMIIRLIDEQASHDPRDFDKNNKYFFGKAARDVMFALLECYPNHYWDNYPITQAQLQETWGDAMISCVYLDIRYHEAEQEDRIRRAKRIARALTASFQINKIWMKFDVSFARFGRWSSEFGREKIRPSIFKAIETVPLPTEDKTTQTDDDLIVEDISQSDNNLP